MGSRATSAEVCRDHPLRPTPDAYAEEICPTGFGFGSSGFGFVTPCAAQALAKQLDAVNDAIKDRIGEER